MCYILIRIGRFELNKIFKKQNIMYCLILVWLAFITSTFSTYIMFNILEDLFANWKIFRALIHVGLCIPSFSILEHAYYGIYKEKSNKIYLGISEFIFSLLVIIGIFILGYNIELKSYK